MIRLYLLILKYKLKYFFSFRFIRRKRFQVILKLDDLTNYSFAVKKMDHFIRWNNICVSWGLVGRSLEEPSKKYIQFLKKNKTDKHYSFFNHGYLHLWQKKYEFNGPSVEEQYDYLIKTQKIAKEKANIVLNCFGAPCNQVSEFTAKALDKIAEIKYWYFGLPNSSKLVLDYPSRINIPPLCPYIFETKAGNIDFYYFKYCWKKGIILKDNFIVLQAHPDMWKRYHWLHFRCCIAYLKYIGADFVLPGAEK